MEGAKRKTDDKKLKPKQSNGGSGEELGVAMDSLLKKKRNKNKGNKRKADERKWVKKRPMIRN